MASPDKLFILQASDVHSDLEKTKKLQQWLKERQQRVDLVLLSGDLANKPMELDSPPDEVAKYHTDLEEVVQQFAAISETLYYIPGNHDAITTFETARQPLSLPCNVHMRRVKIGPNLHLMGHGGSVPGYQHGELKWDGFPYMSEEAMAADLEKLVNPVFFSGSAVLDSTDSVILMTHNGPRECSTTVSFESVKDPIVSGSSKLFELLCTEELQKHVVMNIHGHTHDALGHAQIGNITVINPGALTEGHFGMYTLTAKPAGGSGPLWRIESMHFHSLPS